MRPLLLLAVAAVALAVAQAASPGQADGDSRRFVLPMDTGMPAKSVWPELVGTPCEQARAAIEAAMPAGALVLVVPEHSMVTMDFRSNRVRIFCARETGLVATPPRVG